MRYPEAFVAPMRAELARLGVEEFRTPDDVDLAVSGTQGTLMIIVNSICGCAAGKARPGVALALQHRLRPDRVATVFAGADVEATESARSYFTGYGPSSPSIGLLKNGQLVWMLERRQIENQGPEQIAAMLTAAFDRFCTRRLGRAVTVATRCSEAAEERPPRGHSRPWDRCEDRDQRQSKEDRGELVAPHGVCRLTHAHPTDVRERDGDHHAEEVLDRPESQYRAAHRGAEILKRGSGDRAEDEIQRDTNQELQVEHPHKQLTCAVVARASRRGVPRMPATARPNATRPAARTTHRSSECTTSISGYMARSYAGAAYRTERMKAACGLKECKARCYRTKVNFA